MGLEPIDISIELAIIIQVLYKSPASPRVPTRPSTQVTLLVVYNTSYSVALYGLLMFYKATRPLLTPFKPVQKFVAVKSVIFATYWQSVVVHFIPGVRVFIDLLTDSF